MRTVALVLTVAAALPAHAHAASYRRTITVADAVGEPEGSFGRAIAGTPAGGLLVGTAPVNGNGSAQLFDTASGALQRVFWGPGCQPGCSTFSTSVAAVADDVLVGEPWAREAGSPTGAFVGAVYRLDGGTGAVEHTFRSPSPTPGARFGEQIALRGGELLVTERGFVHRFDLASTAFLGSLVAPPGSSPLFGASLVALGSMVAVGDPGAGRVVLFDAPSGAVLRIIPNPVPGEGARFGHSVATLGGDLLVGAPHAAAGGAAYRIAVRTGSVRATYASPAPGATGSLGFSVGTFGDAVVTGDASFSLLEDGLDSGAVHVFEAATGRLIAILGRGGLDADDAFGTALAEIGDQLFAGAPSEDVNTVTGFRLDCGGATGCTARDARLSHARAWLGAGRAVIRTRLRLTAAELDQFARLGGSVCLYGTPLPALPCAPFVCAGDDRRLECTLRWAFSGTVSLKRRGDRRGRMRVTLADAESQVPAGGPLALRLNVGPLLQHAEGSATRAAALPRCRQRRRGVRCR